MTTFFIKKILAFFPLFCLAFLGGGSGGCSQTVEQTAGGASSPGTNDWLYQLQNYDLASLGATAFDLIVMDYSSDGSEEGEFTAEEIAAIKNSPGGSKIVLSYMSIGEAEEGRFYFDPTASFIAASNPDFPDNFKVRFWEPEWQAIVFAYLDRILNAGFDGVYLDIIDAFEFFGPGGEMPERPTAGADMIDFVIAIANRARVAGGVSGFLVFPQNGAAILDEEGGADYLAAVDGIGAEDTFYFGDLENNNDLDLDHAGEVTPYLNQFVDSGKTVLAIDYVQTASKISDFYERARANGYIPYASVRDLDRITINAGFEPD